MVAIVCKDESAVADVFLKILAFLSGKLHELVPRQVTERAPEELIAFQGDDPLAGIDPKRRVLNKGIQQVGRHALVHVPVTGFVL